VLDIFGGGDKSRQYQDGNEAPDEKGGCDNDWTKSGARDFTFNLGEWNCCSGFGSASGNGGRACAGGGPGLFVLLQYVADECPPPNGRHLQLPGLLFQRLRRLVHARKFICCNYEFTTLDYMGGGCQHSQPVALYRSEAFHSLMARTLYIWTCSGRYALIRVISTT
jgi:hypothetical protein